MKCKFLSKIGLMALVIGVGVISSGYIKTNAAPIENATVKLTQPNGEVIECLTSGDEFYNYLHDTDGRAIVKDPSTGYYVYGKYVSQKVIPSRERVTAALVKEVKGKTSDSRVKMTEVKVPLDQIQKKRELMGANKKGNVNISKKNHGKLNNLVIFIKFSDQGEFNGNFTKYNSDFNNPTQNSLNNYFKQTSYNKLDVSTSFYPKPQGDKIVTYTDSHPRSYYSNVPENEQAKIEHELLKNAIEGVKSQIPSDLNVDFDNDGKVDNVCFIIKGENDGWASLLWPHQWNLYTQDVRINNKLVDLYNFQLESFLENEGSGVLCHEMFHTLGAPDLYHYNHDGKIAVGPWDVMDHTNNKIPQSMGAYMKMRYGGWIDKIDEISTSGTYSIKSLDNEKNNSYIIRSPRSKSEYFVVEYRKKTGLYEKNLPNEGLVVYRINGALDGNGNMQNGDEVYIYRPNGSIYRNGSINNAPLNQNLSRTTIGDSLNPLYFSNGSSTSNVKIFNVKVLGDEVKFDVRIG